MTKKKTKRKIENNDKYPKVMYFEDGNFSLFVKTKERIIPTFTFKTTIEALYFSTKLEAELIPLTGYDDVVVRVSVSKSFISPKDDDSIPLTHKEIAEIHKNDSAVQITVGVIIGYEKTSRLLLEKINLINKLSKDKKALSEYLADALDYYKNKEYCFIDITGLTNSGVFLKDLKQLIFIYSRFYIEKKEARNIIGFLFPPDSQKPKLNSGIVNYDSSPIIIEEDNFPFPKRLYVLDYTIVDGVPKPTFYENGEGETL